jgi:hypothetical protein
MQGTNKRRKGESKAHTNERSAADKDRAGRGKWDSEKGQHNSRERALGPVRRPSTHPSSVTRLSPAPQNPRVNTTPLRRPLRRRRPEPSPPFVVVARLDGRRRASVAPACLSFTLLPGWLFLELRRLHRWSSHRSHLCPVDGVCLGAATLFFLFLLGYASPASLSPSPPSPPYLPSLLSF